MGLEEKREENMETKTEIAAATDAWVAATAAAREANENLKESTAARDRIDSELADARKQLGSGNPDLIDHLRRFETSLKAARDNATTAICARRQAAKAHSQMAELAYAKLREVQTKHAADNAMAAWARAEKALAEATAEAAKPA
jgi:chromosome segregation ATPase